MRQPISLALRTAAVRTLPVAAGFVTALTLPACGSGDSTDPGTAGSGLAGALATVDAAPGEDFGFEWSDTARIRELAGVGTSIGELDLSKDDAAQYSRLLTLGWGPLGGQVSAETFDAVGFNPLGGDQALTAGVTADRATRFDGVDASGVAPALEELGAKEIEASGETFLAVGDEGELIEEGLDQFGLGLPLGINRVVVQGDSVAVGGFEEPVAATMGEPDAPLSEEAPQAAAASCLGEVVGASMIGGGVAGAPDEVQIAAVGVLDPGDGSEGVPEVLCAVGAEGADLSDVRGAMESSLGKGGVDPATGIDVSDLLGKVEVSEGEAEGLPYLRALATPPADQPVGAFYGFLAQGSLSFYLGGDPLGAGPNLSPKRLEELRERSGG